ncbi:MAG: REDY-like protein HapK [Gammaproteobacteria bacterium]|nr:REDY-like protein HapK [Gammaproteobacteria bacterium]TVQ48763.1 MAG: REDY-like protein HapK [Gammaproteobacteria bacterium]
MPQIIVLFNLKTDADRDAYEHWAKTTDLPTVRGLSAVDGFDALRAEGLLGGDGKPPYEYIEVIRINDMARFREEVGTDAMRQVAAEFRGFADSPQFIVCEALG